MEYDLSRFAIAHQRDYQQAFVFCLGCAVIRRLGMIYGFLFKMRQGIISGCVVLLRLRKQDRALCTECGIRESYS